MDNSNGLVGDSSRRRRQLINISHRGLRHGSLPNFRCLPHEPSKKASAIFKYLKRGVLEDRQRFTLLVRRRLREEFAARPGRERGPSLRLITSSNFFGA